MSYVETVIGKFNGIRPMARAMRLPPTTVQGWKLAGHIPAKRIRDVLNAAETQGIHLTIEDVVPPAEPPTDQAVAQ